jgi:hypothetical protein
MEDEDFSDDFDSEDEDDLELEDEWDTPSESEDGGKNKKQKGKKTDQKRNIPAVTTNAPARGRVTRSTGIVESERNGRRSKNEKSLENEEAKLLMKPINNKGVKRP